MADERKVKVIDFEAAWDDLKLTLRELVLALSEASPSPACAEYAVGKMTAYAKVLSIMDDFEELYEEAE